MATPIKVSYFDAPFQVLFSELAERAMTQSQILTSSPGAVVTLEKKGRPYLYWRSYDARGKRVDRYIGPKDAAETASSLAEIEAASPGRDTSPTLARVAEAGYAAPTTDRRDAGRALQRRRVPPRRDARRHARFGAI
jgi:hypothetical protein